MGRPIRDLNPSHIRLVTIRTEEAKLFMAPTAENGEKINEIVGGVIAKYQAMFSIVIYAYVVCGNHYHILLRAPESNLWRFSQAINREIAKRINSLLGRKGHFWYRRYDDQVVLEGGDALEALIYIICNPVNHGLVEDPREWPGLNCLEQLFSGEARIFSFFDGTAYSVARRKAKKGKEVDPEDYKDEYSLVLSPLPIFEGSSHEEMADKIEALVKERCEEIKADRRKESKGFLGIENIRNQSPFSVPKSVKNSPRPLCYSKCSEAKKLFLGIFLSFVETYREASRRFRSGDLSTLFPPFTIKPPLLYILSEA